MFSNYANNRKDCSRKGDQNKGLPGSKTGAHDQMMNMLTVSRERAHAFAQPTIHNSNHIHQRDGNEPQRGHRIHRV